MIRKRPKQPLSNQDTRQYRNKTETNLINRTRQ
ncbi:hypothetical protein COLO4_06944 [Corchorus olitorius]|uniref:Uncharacterized protein n=1 Tax=Corchorus olitorius TaxID=93759 RepID=A0A1R3KLF1_9ROSI|nr:hypothetical protein COLO4_06944 [Corchorus olitorius]